MAEPHGPGPENPRRGNGKNPGAAPPPPRQRRDGDELAPGADQRERQPTARREMPPPVRQPLPGEEEAVGRAGGEQLVPLLAERRQAAGVLDALERQSRRIDGVDHRAKACTASGSSPARRSRDSDVASAVSSSVQKRSSYCRASIPWQRTQRRSLGGTMAPAAARRPRWEAAGVI